MNSYLSAKAIAPLLVFRLFSLAAVIAFVMRMTGKEVSTKRVALVLGRAIAALVIGGFVLSSLWL
jgi:hypothetical protein